MFSLPVSCKHGKWAHNLTLSEVSFDENRKTNHQDKLLLIIENIKKQNCQNQIISITRICMYDTRINMCCLYVYVGGCARVRACLHVLCIYTIVAEPRGILLFVKIHRTLLFFLYCLAGDIYKFSLSSLTLLQSYPLVFSSFRFVDHESFR